MEYVGEHLWVGQVGHFSIVFGFVMALLATVAYIFSTLKRENTDLAKSWARIGRFAFIAHGLAVFTLIGVLLYAMGNQYFEYDYVFQHVSKDLDMSYILSAFWEGQEGSFMLWMFWHIILGYVFMFTNKKWEAPVLAIVASVEVFLLSMILGIHFGDFKLGSNPTLLMREVRDFPFLSNPEYLSLPGLDGNGLNELLQNYWMTIHPPVLFLGFASTLFPFAFALSGIWTKSYKEWLEPVLPWALFSAAIFGLGILMGGAWAYEALSFGGYWAWDPVENSSLVPWIIIVAGVHMNVVAKATGHSLRGAMGFYLFGFVLTVYSTFLTRSGVLGDTSVHAFTEMGLEAQLTVFLFTYLFFALFPLLKNYKKIPSNKKEEAATSKEFWMLLGGFVLLFSTIIISVQTSFPVFNKIIQIFNEDFMGWSISEAKRVETYNKSQIWVAFFIALLSGVAQFLRYRETEMPDARIKKVSKHLGISAGVAVVVTGLVAYFIGLGNVKYVMLTWACLFSVISNLDFLITSIKGNVKLAGSAFSHIGFGLMILGSVVSGVNSYFISKNEWAMQDVIEGADRNVLLYKGYPIQMSSGYEMTYVKDTFNSLHRVFEINYKKLDEQRNVIEEFTLYPELQYSSKSNMLVQNPDTRHYWHKDIYSHISGIHESQQTEEAARNFEDSLSYYTHQMAVGDTIQLAKGAVLRLAALDYTPEHNDYVPLKGDIRIGARFNLVRPEVDTTFLLQPMAMVRGENFISFADKCDPYQVKLKLTSESIRMAYADERVLDYESFSMSEGQTINYKGYTLVFSGFDKTPENTAYEAEEGDIVVGANMVVFDENQQDYHAQPIYLIRNNQPFNLKDEIRPLGIHFRFTNLDPNSGKVSIMIAKSEPREEVIEVMVADNVPRTDWVALQAKVFPGINLFWIGSLVMLFGFVLAMIHRISTKRKSFSSNEKA